MVDERAKPARPAPETRPSDDALSVRLAWLYYIGGLSQAEAAERLGIGRTRANRLLAEARDSGLVTVTIDHAAAADLALEARIAAVFALDFCIATPPLGLETGPEACEPALRRVQGAVARRAVGVAAARWLKARIECGAARVIGVGWGRTLAEMARHLQPSPGRRPCFVSLMGSLGRDAAASPFEVVHLLAARAGGEGRFLPAPFAADSPADRAVLLSQRIVAAALDVARAADLHIVSVGEVDAEAALCAEQFIDPETCAELRAAGAVGDTVGMFFDAAGRQVEHPISERTIGPAAADLRRAPVVLLAGGPEKAAATAALLRSGLVRGLIIDGDTARALGARLDNDATVANAA